MNKIFIPQNLKKAIPVVVAIIILAVSIYLINANAPHDASVTSGASAERATVVEVVSGEITQNANGIYTGSQVIKAEVKSGALKGKTIEATNTADQYSGVICKEGTSIILAISEADGNIYSFVSGYDYTIIYVALILLFAICMIVIAGKKGFKALIGLAITVITLIWIFVPLLCYGLSPYWTSILWAAITTLVTIALISGYSKKTVSAVISTVIGVSASGIIASLFGYFAHISGYNMDYAEEIVLLNIDTPIKVSGLLFAGILIASLGAVMDVCMSIASAINEIHEANKNITKNELFRAGMNVGRDTMGTMANTLILAFAGSAITMIVLLYAYNSNMNYFVSMSSIAIEIIQGISGSIGICLCVPTVSFIASRLATMNIIKK